MSDEVDFPRELATNGSVQVIEKYFKSEAWDKYVARCDGTPDLLPLDHLVAWLWFEGFKVVPK